MSGPEAYRLAREAAARHGLALTLTWPPGLKADALLGYAHGLEDAAQQLKRWAEAEAATAGVAGGGEP